MTWFYIVTVIWCVGLNSISTVFVIKTIRLHRREQQRVSNHFKILDNYDQH